MCIRHKVWDLRWFSWRVVLGTLILAVPGGCPKIDPSAGHELPVVNLPPVVLFYQPAGNVSLYQGESTMITWHAADAEDSARVDLYCDRDGVYGTGDETLLTTVYTDADRPDLSYVWAVGQILPGTYRILAVADDGQNDPVTAVLMSTITVQSTGPSLAIFEPAVPISIEPGRLTTIGWSYDAPRRPAAVTLFCDDDRDVANGVADTIMTTQVPVGSDSRTHTWQVPALPAGQYYVGATLDDQEHPPVTVYAAATIGIDAPALHVDSPASNVTIRCADCLAVKWRTANVAQDAQLTIFLDRDGVAGSGDEDPLASLSQAAGTSGGACNVSLPVRVAGQYRVGVKMDDGHNAPVVAYAAGRVTVAGPGLVFNQPSQPAAVRSGDRLPVQWIGQSGNANVSLTVFYDDNQDFADGTLGTVVTRNGPQNAAGDAVDWQVALLPAGTYWVGGVLDDGTNAPAVTYAAGAIQVMAPVLTFSQPGEAISVRGGNTLPVGWKAQSGTASAALTIFYDDNKVHTDGTLGIVTERSGTQNAAGDTTNWKVPALPAGTYFIGGILDDGLNDPVVAYATAQVVVDGPALTLTAPAQDIVVARNSATPIAWTAQAGGTGVTVTVFYDDDRDFSNGTLGEALEWKGTPKTGGDTATWTVPALAARTYCIGATVNDGVNPPVAAYAAGRVYVSNSTLVFVKPDRPVLAAKGDVVDVQWLADTDRTAATITIFYDDDQNPANGTSGQIVQRTGVPTTAGDSVAWTLPALKGGVHYIGGQVDDGMNPPLVAYAVGTVAVPPAQLTVTQPGQPVHVLAGSKVQIAWSHTTQATAAKVELFYDTDTNRNNGIQDTIATVDVPGSATGMTFAWDTPSALGGLFYIGATLTDGLNSPLMVYAAGRVQLESHLTLTRPLEEVEFVGFGRTFRGLSPGGRLGAVASHVPWTRWREDPKDPRPAGQRRLVRQPGIDFNADQFDDFVLVAPSANPFYLERQNAGEAYLVHSDPVALFDLSMSLDPLVVSKTGSSNAGGDSLHGVIFAGPASTGTTEGIGAVTICPDVDGDSIPEVLFGFPWVETIHQEEQDYDPWDQSLDALSRGAWNPRTYSDLYRNPEGSSDLLKVDEQMDHIGGGFVVAVAGSNGQIGAALTQSPNQNTVIGLDHVGQIRSDAHSLVVQHAEGLRMYCPDAFRRPPEVDFETTYAQTPIGGDNLDRSRFGESMVEADVNGDGRPEWIFAQPARPGDATDSSKGWLYVMWPDLSYIWGADLTLLPESLKPSYISIKEVTTKTVGTAGQVLDAGGNPVNDPVTGQPIPTVITTITTTTILYESILGVVFTTTTVHVEIREVDPNGDPTQYPPQPPADTRTTVAASAPAGMNPLALDCTKVYSWPYAVGVGNYSMEITIDGNTGAITDVKEVDDTREREYVYPMFFDWICGYNLAEHGHGHEVLGYLKGLANAGDFNHDNREDITLGAPQANPDGLSNAGCAFLVFGRANFGDQSLSGIGLQDDDALAGIKIAGTAANQQVGSSQANAGDVNGDGISDWILGIPGYNGGAGAAAIIYGTSGRQGAYRVSDIGTAVLPGILLTGDAAGDVAGSCVAGVGDVDGDGYDDVAIVAGGAGVSLIDGSRREHCGVTYLVYGGPGFMGASGTRSLADIGTAKLPGKIYAGLPGGTNQVQTVAPAGDVDNDGLADFLIGNPAADAQNALDVGEVYLIRGSDRLAP